MNGLQLRDVDSVLPFVGEFGRFQIITTLLFCLTVIGTGYHSMTIYFVAANPHWTCKPESTLCILNGTFGKDDALYSFRCKIDRKEWQYTEADSYSIVTQFGLYCEDEYLIQLLVVVTFIGWALGSIFWSWLADMYGRMKVFIICLFFSITFTFICAFSPAYWFFGILRFFIGFVAPGTVLQIFVLQSEYVGGSHRPFTGIILWFAFALSLLLLGGKAFALKDWKMLLIITSAPYAIFLAIIFYIPESYRCHHITGKTDQAMKTLAKVAKRNGKILPNISLPKTERQKVHHLMILQGKKMRKRTIIQIIAWVVNGTVYYASSMGVEYLTGNFYRDYILSTAVELPAALAAIYGCTRIGRKWTVAIPMFAAGVFCITVSAFARQASSETFTALRLIFLLLAKFSITVSFDALYTWSTELYPTAIRSQGLSIVQASSRFGMALVPWTSGWLKSIHPVLPYSMIGLGSFASAVSLMWLPETRGAKTAEHLADDEYEIKPGTGGTSFSNLAEQSISLDDFHS